MSATDPNRVLNRRGAREVTDAEMQRITGSGGALVPTRLTDFLTGTSTNPDQQLDE